MSHAETQRQKKWEAIAWLDRTLPLSARFPKGCIFREYRPPVPAEALREVILNAEMLSGDHPSILRNPLIAGAFHRTGAVEVWGRGTNRVIEACRAHGIAPPEFSEQAGVVTVTFRATVGPEAVKGPGRDQAGTKQGLSRVQVQVLELAVTPRSFHELMEPAGRTNKTKFRDQVVGPLLEAGLLEMTIPDKPTSPRQQYRTTPTGRRLIDKEEAPS